MLATAGSAGVGRNKTGTGEMDGGTSTATVSELESWLLMLAAMLTIGQIARRRSRPEAN